MALATPLLGFLSLFILAGGTLLQIFIILSGVRHAEHTPINRVFFLEADTTGITGARNPSRWTYWAICGVVNGVTGNCGSPVPALPFNPVENFGTGTGVPTQFINNHYWFYMSRFAWVFYLVALLFAALALAFSLLALCSRLGARLVGSLTAVALFFQILASALMTAWTYKARKDFRSGGMSAHLGTYVYGFSWGAVGCFLICTVLYHVGGSVGKDRAPSSGKSRFGRSRSTRSRGTFIDESESQHRVKDEYE